MCGHICKAPALKAEISRELKSPFLALAENRAHTKLNEVKSYHLYIPSKRCSSITVERKPVSQAAGKTTSPPHHAALKVLHPAYRRNGFDNAAREKYIMAQHSQLSILHPTFSTIINNQSC